MNQINELTSKEKKLAVVGLGYVGLPLAVAFSEYFDVIGFDQNERKIEQYLKGVDVTKEVGDEAIRQCRVEFTSDPSKLKEANFVVVAVPTPVHMDKTPDLAPVLSASRTVGRHLEKDTIVVFESTVYPGVTEENCVEEIERCSGFTCGEDFYIGYSPERINPGDKVHRLRNIVKIVSGMNDDVREQIAQVYGTIINKSTGGDIYLAETIKVAEAAKLVENSQRDINIAFMNELSLAFHKMGINTADVINAMNTKWNALHFYPGLVGGHCIGVDPYYFVYDAEKYGYHSTIIANGRRINDDMPQVVAGEIVKELVKAGGDIHAMNLVLLGLTFKGNCPDLRNTKSGVVKHALEEFGLTLQISDPEADPEEIREVFGQEAISYKDIHDADCLIFCNNHHEFSELMVEDLKTMLKPDGAGLIVDVCNIFNRKEIEAQGLKYWSL